MMKTTKEIGLDYMKFGKNPEPRQFPDNMRWYSKEELLLNEAICEFVGFRAGKEAEHDKIMHKFRSKKWYSEEEVEKIIESAKKEQWFDYLTEVFDQEHHLVRLILIGEDNAIRVLQRENITQDKESD